MRNIGNNIARRFQEKTSHDGKIGAFVAAVQPLGEKTVRIILASHKELEVTAAREFVFAASRHNLIPYTPTFSKYQGTDGMCYAGITAYVVDIQHLSVDDPKAATFANLQANTFIDQELGNVWERKTIDNKSYFVRSSEDDLESILSEMQASYGSKTGVDVRAFAPKVGVGNVVSFFTMDVEGKPGTATGIVASVHGTDVKVKSNEHFYTIPMFAINQVVQMQAGDAPEEVIKFLREAYNVEGIDYAGLFNK